MTTAEPLRFHTLHSLPRSMELSRGNTRAQCIKPRRWSPMQMTCIIRGWGLGCQGTELVFSHRPVVVDEMIRLRFGPKVHDTLNVALEVFVGVTNHNPNTTTQLPSAAHIKQKAGYWVVKQYTNNESSVRFSLNSSGDLLFYNSQGYVTNGPSLGQVTGSLWAVLVIPAYPFFVAIDSTLPRVNPTAASQGAVQSSVQRGAIPASSSQEGGVSNQTPIINQNPAPQSPSTSSQSAEPESRERTVEGETASTVATQNSDQSECIICNDQPADSAFSPCGHMHTCYNCALDLWQGRGRGTCPSCRQLIANVLRIYRN